MMKIQFDTSQNYGTNDYICETCLKDRDSANYLLAYGDIICGVRLKNIKNVTYFKLFHNDGTNITFTENLDHIQFCQNNEIIVDTKEHNNFVDGYPAVAIKYDHMGYEMDGTADVYFDCIQICDNKKRHNLVNTSGCFKMCGYIFKYANGLFTQIKSTN